MQTDTEDATKGTDQSAGAKAIGKLWRRRSKACAGRAAEPIKRRRRSLTLDAKRNIRTRARTQNGTLRGLRERLQAGKQSKSTRSPRKLPLHNYGWQLVLRWPCPKRPRAHTKSTKNVARTPVRSVSRAG